MSFPPSGLPAHNIKLSTIPCANFSFLFARYKKLLSHSSAEIVFIRTFNKCELGSEAKWFLFLLYLYKL